jgi:type I restriction enzyme, S subunit
MIPDGWDVKPLSAVLAKARLGGNYPNQDAQTDYPLMKMGNIARGMFDVATIEYISPRTHPEEQHRLSCGDVLFNTRNTLDLVGKVAIWRDELPAAYYNSNLLRLEFKPSEIASSLYANYWLNTATAVSKLRGLATGTTSVAAIYTRDLLGFSIAVPPLPEQSAIATVLGEVDALLAVQDALIAKKRAIKKGAMQELLTGKRRLPGFSGEWEVQRLGDCLRANPSYGINASAVAYSDRLPTYIRITDISEDGRFTPSPHVSVNSAFSMSYVLRDGDVVFARTGASVGKSYLYRPEDGELVFAGFLIRIQPDPTILNSAFLAAYVVSGAYWSWVKVMSMRSGQPGINGAEFAKLELPVPTIEEQTAIADLLSDMDASITALDAKRAKTAQVKQGMMQELLTGRIRLV